MSAWELWLVFIVVPGLGSFAAMASIVCFVLVLVLFIGWLIVEDGLDDKIRDINWEYRDSGLAYDPYKKCVMYEGKNDKKLRVQNRDKAIMAVENEQKEFTRKTGSRMVFTAFVGFVLALGATLAPSQKEMALLFITPKVINNPEVQKLPISFVKYLHTLLIDHKEKTKESED